MELTNIDLIKILVSLVIGSVIGLERELRSKSAGFRTIILITIGSTLFTIFSMHLGSLTSPDRIASNIVVGIGFLGTGVIFKGEDRVSGLTTATTIWIAAALGMGVGTGYFMLCGIVSAIVFCVLYGFMFLEKHIDATSQTRNYKIIYSYNPEMIHYYDHLFKEYKLNAWKGKQSRTGNEIVGNWTVHGSERNHERFINELMKDERIKEFDF